MTHWEMFWEAIDTIAALIPVMPTIRTLKYLGWVLDWLVSVKQIDNTISPKLIPWWGQR